jgi:hypothetical protein
MWKPFDAVEEFGKRIWEKRAWHLSFEKVWSG